MIRFDHVTKVFGTRTVLDDVSFEIPQGKMVFIIGQSGAGKSLVVKHMVRLLLPTTGTITYEGQNLRKFSQSELKAFRRQVGFLFQHAALFDSWSVLENIIFPLREHTNMSLKDMHKKADEVLEMVELQNASLTSPTELSVGEKKRVGFARALITDPKLILFDEPTTGLDPLLCRTIDELIGRTHLSRPGLTSVIVSHDVNAALRDGDDIIMLKQGKIFMSGVAEKFQNNQGDYITSFLTGIHTYAGDAHITAENQTETQEHKNP